MQKEISIKAPEVNISEVVDQFYHREPFCNYLPEANKLIFRSALHQENVECFDLKESQKEPDTPLFHLTRNVQNTSPAKSSRVKKRSPEVELGKRNFTLHHYKLS